MATQQELLVAHLTAEDKTKQAFNSVQNNMRNMGKEANRANQQLRLVRGGAGQLGHQIQDIAVQLQMGTNALIVFGQQGSQIASLMGPQGALIGAVLAVGAAIGVGFLNNTKNATNELEELRKKILETVEATGNINEDFRNFLAFARRKDLEKQQETFDETIKQYESASARLTLYENRLDQVTKAEKDGDYAALRSLKTKEEYSKLIAEQEGLISKLRVELGFLKNDLDGVTVATREDAQRRIDASKQLVEQANIELDAIVDAKKKQEKQEELSMKARLSSLSNLHMINNLELDALKRVDDAKKKSADEERDRLEKNAAYRLSVAQTIIDSANAELDAIVQAEEKKKAAKMQSLQLDQMLVQNSQQMVGSIIQNMDKQSGAYKALFALQQAMAIAQTIIQYETAIAQAKGQLGIFGLPMEALLRAQQVASVAIIAGQTIAGFEGGGMIPNGPRAGGVDGRGGRMAIVHPNEKITDLNKGGDNKAVNISFNIQANDAAGFDELLVKRRALIVNMVNKAVNNSGRRSLT